MISFLSIFFFFFFDSFINWNFRCFVAIVVSETDGEEDDESPPAKNEKTGHETHGPLKKLTGLLSLSSPDSSKSGYETTIIVDFLMYCR